MFTLLEVKLSRPYTIFIYITNSKCSCTKFITVNVRGPCTAFISQKIASKPFSNR